MSTYQLTLVSPVVDISYRGIILQNEKKISDCDFKKGATLFVTKKKQPGKLVHVDIHCSTTAVISIILAIFIGNQSSKII